MDVVARDAAAQALGGVVQLHFDKTVEKKRAADLQKQELWRLFLGFFVFLAVLFLAVSSSPPARLQCRHLWAPAGLLSLAHLAFYAAVAHHLRCLNGFRYSIPPNPPDPSLIARFSCSRTSMADLCV